MFLPSVKRIRADWRVGPSKHAVALIPASSVSRIMSSGIPIEAAIPLATLMIQKSIASMRRCPLSEFRPAGSSG